MARHRQAARHAREASRPPILRPPEPGELHALIQRYWADGLDVHDIAARLAPYGVTVHDVLVERYRDSG